MWTQRDEFSTEKQLSNLKSSRMNINDRTQAVRSIVGDNVRELNNNAQTMQQIEEKLKKARRRK